MDVCRNGCFTSWLLLVGAVKVENFPQHLKNELQKLQNSEDMERQLQEIERNTCKVGSSSHVGRCSQTIKHISVPPPGRNFRDGNVIRLQRTLLLPRVRTSTGQRSFAVFGPATWNSLPPSLRAPELSLSTFKRLLKTRLFQRA